MQNDRVLEIALLLLRVSLVLFFLVWTLEKFLHPEKTVDLAQGFYGVAIGPLASYAAGAVQAGFLVLFALALARAWSYGFFLVTHGVSMAASWPQLITPYEGYNHLFHAGIPVFAALACLFLLRDRDRMLSFGQARGLGRDGRQPERAGEPTRRAGGESGVALSVFAIALGLLAALGSAPALAQERGPLRPNPAALGIIRIEAFGQRFEPLQTLTPDSPPRHVSDYDLTVTWDPAGERAREEWHLRTVYPFEGTFEFSGVHHADAGHRSGRDSFRPNPGGAIAPARSGAVFKDLWLANPTVLLAFAPRRLTAEMRDRGRAAVIANGTLWRLTFDSTTGLPLEVWTLEEDPLEGEIENRVRFGDWRQVEGVPFPFRIEQLVGGKLVRREVRRSIELDLEAAEQALALPAEAAPAAFDAAAKARGWQASQFFHRRMSMGAPADEDQSEAVSFHEVGEGVWQIRGSSHHNLLIEGPDGLALVDSVWYPSRSQTILDALAERFSDRPLRYLILTHHHPDHSGGIVPFAEAGAVAVMSRRNVPYFEDVLLKAVGGDAAIAAIADRAVLDGIGRPIEVVDVPNSHAAGMLAVYVADQKLLFNTDLYSPGRETQSRLWASELLSAIDFYGLDVEIHVGGHGQGSEPHAHLIETATGG